jgi:hypothetical protein
MRNSSILKWAPNNKIKKLSNGAKNGSGGGKEEKKWLHAPESLISGHVVYLVKFLGSTEVDRPKGIEVVKQGIQKLKFNQQLKRTEGDKAKTPKVELTISVDGVTIQEPKTKRMMHQYPLHKISYCADDKAEKRFFSFIAKEGETTQHTCFVFVSDKLAEEITLTIGQAFELAYKKFLDTSGKDMETQKQILVLQNRVGLLENENSELKKRLKDVASIKGMGDVQQYMHSHDITDLCDVPDGSTVNNTPEVAATAASPAPPPPQLISELICLDLEVSGVGIRLDGFSLDDINDDDFNPRAPSDEDEEESPTDFDPRAESERPVPPASAAMPLTLTPPALPPRVANNNSQNNLTSTPFQSEKQQGNIFSSNPFSGGGADPFGMAAFDSPTGPAKQGLNALPSPFVTSLNASGGGGGGEIAPNNFFDDLDPLNKK